jgi:hypothetical protein
MRHSLIHALSLLCVVACGQSSRSPAPPTPAPTPPPARDPEPPHVALFEEKNLRSAPDSEGDLSPKAIDGPIRRESARFRACYDVARAKQPTLQGKVIMKFTITPGGSVGKHTVTGLDDAVAACVGAVLAKVRFPDPAHDVNVSYPLVFEPK